MSFNARELEKRAKAGDSLALEKLGEVVVSYEAMTSAEHTRKKQKEKWKEKVGAAEARFRNEIESPHPPGAKEADHSKKLRRVEVAYQDHEDAKAAAKEADNVCKAEIKKQKKRLSKAMENSAQLTMDRQWAGEGDEAPSDREADGADGLGDDVEAEGEDYGDEDEGDDPLDGADELDEDSDSDDAEGDSATF